MRQPGLFTLIALVLLSTTAGAEDMPILERWVADPAKSTLGFTATQEGAAFDGKFGSYSVGLELVQKDTGVELVSIGTTIQLGSVDTDYGERDEYLAAEDWFHIAVWPEATFKAAVIRQLDNNQYVADGKLTLRGISQNVAVKLSIAIDQSNERGTLTGSASLNRLDFGVGQGDWSTTEWVGDMVDVKFNLHILRAFE